MNIGIVVYSQTGHTGSVALKLKEKLAAKGHSVNIEKITPVGEVHPGAKNIRFDKLPGINEYDALIFGAPVQAFALASAMSACIPQLPPFGGKKTACFVTMGLPFTWMGGKNAISKVEKLCGGKGAKVCGTGIVRWIDAKREKETEALLENMSKLF